MLLLWLLLCVLLQQSTSHDGSTSGVGSGFIIITILVDLVGHHRFVVGWLDQRTTYHHPPRYLRNLSSFPACPQSDLVLYTHPIDQNPLNASISSRFDPRVRSVKGIFFLLLHVQQPTPLVQHYHIRTHHQHTSFRHRRR